MKKQILSYLLILLSVYSYSQTPQDSIINDSSLVNSIITKSTNSAIEEINKDICSCIDSIENTLEVKQKNKKIAACFHRHVITYQVMDKTIIDMKNSTNKKNEINISIDENSSIYKSYYYKLESYAMENCNSLIELNKTIDRITSKNSVTDNEMSMKYYSEGIAYSEKENYKKAIESYKKALEIDPKFAFAWDNLGLTYRKNGEYKKAINCYEKSLEIDSMGQVPLHNIPIAYEKLEDYDNALKAYRNIASRYPDDPETFFGAGRVFMLKKDYENALEELCTAYILYIKQNSPYRVDAEKLIGYIYSELKKDNKEEIFNKILTDHNINFK